MTKFSLKCTNCNSITPDFKAWFAQNQTCVKCKSKRSEVWYTADYSKLSDVFKGQPSDFWAYFDYLPLSSRENIITFKEGAVPYEEWGFLEDYAKQKFDLAIKVFVCRNDLNGGTGTFKDVAAALAASLFKENGITQYCIASTGNTATSYALYLSLANISASIFIPNNALKASEVMISALGQQLFRVVGDYAKSKKIANEFATKYNIPISSGNIDPIRVEAKKTMVFEWLRQLKAVPDVYIQAVSGGTGPLAVDKGVRELQSVYPNLKNPRFILVQPDRCDPMVQAWEKAESNGFPPNFENEYMIIDNPNTAIPTLATGNPTTYPIVARLVRASNGAFVRMKESHLADYGKLVAFERKIFIGPASAVCIAGFFEALQKGMIKNGETVLINIGEGVRRAPDFVEQMKGETKIVENVETCFPQNINDTKKSVLIE